MLQKLQVRTDVSMDGDDAEKAFLMHGYDGIILKIIPEDSASAINTVERIRKHKELESENLPILGVTSDMSKESLQKWYDAGIDEFVADPIDLEDLSHMLKAFFEKHSDAL